MSYITENLQVKLNLKPIKIERLHLNTFGTTSYKTQSCNIVRLSLQKPGCEEIVVIFALNSPVICSPLPSAVDSQRYSHLNGRDAPNMLKNLPIIPSRTSQNLSLLFFKIPPIIPKLFRSDSKKIIATAS